MSLVEVKKQNIQLLETFIENLGEASKTFRYFNKRPVDVIRNHLVTLLILENETPIAYGHLDPDSNTVWLGICVLPKFFGKGYGSMMMKALIKEARKLRLDCIELTVDKKNKSAIGLYEKFSFIKVASTEIYFQYAYVFSYPNFNVLKDSGK